MANLQIELARELSQREALLLISVLRYAERSLDDVNDTNAVFTESDPDNDLGGYSVNGTLLESGFDEADFRRLVDKLGVAV